MIIYNLRKCLDGVVTKGYIDESEMDVIDKGFYYNESGSVDFVCTFIHNDDFAFTKEEAIKKIAKRNYDYGVKCLDEYNRMQTLSATAMVDCCDKNNNNEVGNEIQ